jgi:hypothetical protein
MWVSDSTKYTALSVENLQGGGKKKKNVHPTRTSIEGMYRLLIGGQSLKASKNLDHTFHSYCRDNLRSNNYRYWLERKFGAGNCVLLCQVRNNFFKIMYRKYIFLIFLQIPQPSDNIWGSQSGVFWNVTPCSLVNVHRCGTCCSAFLFLFVVCL